MVRILTLCSCLLLSSPALTMAGEAGMDGQAAAPRSAGGSELVAGVISTGEEVREAESVSVGEQTAAAEETENGKESEAKEMSGMSIVGNDEAPKSLYIVPWRSSEIGVQASLDTMLNEDDVPVDREVFKRQIEFYQVSTGK